MAKEEKIIWDGKLTPDELQALRDAINCTFPILCNIDSAKQELKDIFDALHEKTGIPRRTFNFLIKTNFKGNGFEEISKNRELEEIFTALTEDSK